MMRGFLGRVLAAAATTALVATGLAAQPAQAAPGELITNGGFTSVSNGLPTGWSRWNAAGDALLTIEPTSGPQGNPAVRIDARPSTDATDRLAITQAVPYNDTMPRTLKLSGSMKASGLNASNWTSIRVQGRAGSVTTLPVDYVGFRLGSTYGWTDVSKVIEVPLGTTTLLVEPMLDRSGGTVWFSNLSLRPVSVIGNVQATTSPAGVVELFWNFTDLTPATYAVYRSTGTTAPIVDPTTYVGTAWAPTYADDTATPGTTYTYVIVARSADGSTLQTSDPIQVITPAIVTPSQKSTVLTAHTDATGIQVGWALGSADTAATGLSIWAAPKQVDALRAPAKKVADVAAGATSVTLPATSGPYLYLARGTTILASTGIAQAAHPRTVLTPSALAGIRDRIVTEPTVAGSWANLKARVDANAYGAGTAPALYKAREAALVYAVTGDARYAQIAYDAVVAGSGHVKAMPTNMGLELGRAMLLLAPTYDWAYNGWTDEQRAYTRALILKGSDLLSTYHHDALDNVQKTSNWVGVARTTELAALLVIRGDGDAEVKTSRIAFLADQVMQHLDQGYTDTGYTQEGWDYFHYAGLYMLPSAYMSIDAGLVDLKPHLTRPQWWNMALHTISARSTLNTAQWGVGSPATQTQGIIPLLMPLTPVQAQPGLRWTYDVTRGLNATPKPLWDGNQDPMTVIYWTAGSYDRQALNAAKGAWPAILDDTAGAYWFRSGYSGPNDVLATINNRNQQHKGWSGSETFGLSLMGLDTTWALMGGKSTNPLHFSKPLIDGKLEARGEYETVRGEGVTLASKAYGGQGGGYVSLDGSKNFQVASATREAVVDLATEQGRVALLAFSDSFSDSASHRYDWQLRPETGVTISIPGTPEGPTFVFTKGDQVLSGYVVGEGFTVENVSGTLRLSATGTAAQFRVLLVLGTGVPTATVAGSTVTLGSTVVDFENLAGYRS